MNGGVFEDGDLSMVSISGINFGYDTNRVGYLTLGSDIQKLCDIPGLAKGELKDV